jgi:hypothetical protein
MVLPKVRMDWTVSIGHVGSVIVFIVGAFFAYTDLKSDVRDAKTTAEAKYREYDRLWAAQKLLDDEQNQRILRIFTNLTDQIRDVKTDIRSDIRDLRNDGLRNKK